MNIYYRNKKLRSSDGDLLDTGRVDGPDALEQVFAAILPGCLGAQVGVLFDTSTRGLFLLVAGHQYLQVLGVHGGLEEEHGGTARFRGNADHLARLVQLQLALAVVRSLARLGLDILVCVLALDNTLATALHKRLPTGGGLLRRRHRRRGTLRDGGGLDGIRGGGIDHGKRGSTNSKEEDRDAHIVNGVEGR